MNKQELRQTAEDLVRSKWEKYTDAEVKVKYGELLQNKRLKDLEKYQDNWRRTALDYKDRTVSLEQQKKDHEVRMERRKTFQPKKLPEKVFMNHNMKWYLKTEVTKELLRKEEDWAIDWLDHLQNNK